MTFCDAELLEPTLMSYVDKRHVTKQRHVASDGRHAEYVANDVGTKTSASRDIAR